MYVIYNFTYGKEIGERISKEIEEYEKEGIIVEGIIIEGDFNIRIGELEGEEEEWGTVRRNKDKTIENGSRKLIEISKQERIKCYE